MGFKAGELVDEGEGDWATATLGLWRKGQPIHGPVEDPAKAARPRLSSV